jgi:hypothetical protein
LSQIVLQQSLVDRHPCFGALGSGNDDELRFLGCIARHVEPGHIRRLAGAGLDGAFVVETGAESLRQAAPLMLT